MRNRTYVSSLVCALVLVGCNDHRYGFFGDTEGEGGSTEGTGTTGISTLSPTTVSPTTVQPTTLTDPVPTTTDPTVPTTITTVTSTPTTETTSGGILCGELTLPSEVPVQGFASLLGQPDQFSLSCGGIGGSDVAWVWTAPFSGRFLVETSGSNFDTLLSVVDGVCFGPELGCDDDGGGNATSRLEVDLFAGQTVTFIVDSFQQNSGDVLLTVTEVPVPPPPPSECPDGDFGSQLPFQTAGQTAGAPNERAAFCGGQDSPEIEAMWTAPFEGLFRFEVIDSDFNPVMYVLNGSCFEPELDCSDDAVGLNPRLDMFLGAGQPVIIVVDGAFGSAGKFTLRIDTTP